MTNLTMEELTPTSPSEVKPEEVVETPVVETPTEQDPLKVELERVQKKEGPDRKEKLLFTKKRIEKQLKDEFNIGPDDESEPENDDDQPLTVGMLKKIQQDRSAQTALDLAEEIPNESERELVKHFLTNTIKTSGNPNEDLNMARAIVNAAKNKQIIEQVSQKPDTKTHSSSSSVPPKHEEEIVYTAQEKMFIDQFKLTKEDILKARALAAK